MKSFEQIQTASKEGFEAFTASSTALTKGYQAVATEVADFSKKAFEKSVSHWEKAVAADSFDKAFEVQQAFAKETFDATVAEFTKLGELYAAAAKSAFKPYEVNVDAVEVSQPKPALLLSTSSLTKPALLPSVSSQTKPALLPTVQRLE